MTSEMEQIKLSYESLGMTPEDIAENRSLEVTVVKMALMNVSSKYRKDCGVELKAGSVPDEKPKICFTDEQEERALETIVNLAAGAESDGVRLKAAMYIRDDRQGRLEIVKGFQGLQINVLEINNILRNEMAKANDMIYGSSKQKSIEV